MVVSDWLTQNNTHFWLVDTKQYSSLIGYSGAWWSRGTSGWSQLLPGSSLHHAGHRVLGQDSENLGRNQVDTRFSLVDIINHSSMIGWHNTLLIYDWLFQCLRHKREYRARKWWSGSGLETWWTESHCLHSTGSPGHLWCEDRSSGIYFDWLTQLLFWSLIGWQILKLSNSNLIKRATKIFLISLLFKFRYLFIIYSRLAASVEREIWEAGSQIRTRYQPRRREKLLTSPASATQLMEQLYWLEDRSVILSSDWLMQRNTHLWLV